MNETNDQLRHHCQSQLDLALDLCRLGFGCCEKLTEINTTTVRRLIAQVEADREALLRAETAGFAVAGGHITLACWASTLACGLEYQRRVFAGLSQR